MAIRLVFFEFSTVFGRKIRLNYGEDLFFFFFEITCFRPEKFKTDENLGQEVPKQTLRVGQWKIFKIKMGYG